MSGRTCIFPILIVTLAAAQPAAAQRGCRLPAGQFFSLGTTPLEIAPGETRQLSAGGSVGPYAPMEPLPRGCGVRYTLDPRAPARIDARGRLAVSAGAPVGAEFRVRAVMGRDTAVREVHVVDPHLASVTGTWGQAEAARCTPAAGALEPVRELTLRRDGRFSVTFTPFETYNDYWGRYTWNAATGALSMRVEGGNRVPAGIDLDGTARVEDRRLLLDGLWLGQPEPSPARACRYTFSR
ncbi:MAG TPA: hypothetical protein VFJ82_20085 [Longimicrobium sp.]|nr:hypothetical protein [Longimicrobium sp.]